MLYLTEVPRNDIQLHFKFQFSPLSYQYTASFKFFETVLNLRWINFVAVLWIKYVIFGPRVDNFSRTISVVISAATTIAFRWFHYLCSERHMWLLVYNTVRFVSTQNPAVQCVKLCVQCCSNSVCQHHIRGLGQKNWAKSCEKWKQIIHHVSVFPVSWRIFLRVWRIFNGSSSFPKETGKNCRKAFNLLPQNTITLYSEKTMFVRICLHFVVVPAQIKLQLSHVTDMSENNEIPHQTRKKIWHGTYFMLILSKKFTTLLLYKNIIVFLGSELTSFLDFSLVWINYIEILSENLRTRKKIRQLTKKTPKSWDIYFYFLQDFARFFCPSPRIWYKKLAL